MDRILSIRGFFILSPEGYPPLGLFYFQAARP
jgi:hypothetical protein